MPSNTPFRREIESLHQFFVDWYTGQTARDTYDRVEHALGSDFVMVTPEGVRHGYDEVVAEIRAGYAGHEPGAFEIDIRNVETRYAFEDRTLVRYEEWQETPAGRTGRLSTTLFEAEPDAPGDLVWLDLHETWLDGPDSGGQ